MVGSRRLEEILQGISRMTMVASLADDAAPSFSEEALALQFAELHADDLRYVAMWNKWLMWGETRWVADETRKAFNEARNLCRGAAAAINKPREAKSIASAKTRAAVVSLSGEDRRLAATADQWDADPGAFNTKEAVP